MWSGDPSLLSSVPGHPRGAMAEKAGTWWAKGLRLCCRQQVECGGRHVYVQWAEVVRVDGFAWLTGAGAS